MNIDSKLREIVGGIGSPWGEGADYTGPAPFESSHINSEEDKIRLMDDIKQLINEFGEKLIGKDHRCEDPICGIENKLRSEMRERKNILLGGEKE